jgi:hypothetical protein
MSEALVDGIILIEMDEEYLKNNLVLSVFEAPEKMLCRYRPCISNMWFKVLVNVHV